MRTWGRTLLAVALMALALPATAVAPSPAEAGVLDDLEARFLTTRPDVGPTWVVHVAGESSQRILTMRTLQGLVNRTQARIYVIDGGDPGAQALLDRYVARGLVTVTDTTTIDGALDEFAGEATGYVLADLSEPWSVHGASVIAGLEGGIVATADQVADLQSHGLVELDDTRGRWPDAVTAYQALHDTYGDQLASETMAVVRPTDTLWDFIAQQGILPVFTRPSDATWGPVSTMFADVPDGLPVYGYLSDTGDEEAIAVATLAATNLVLVPTDTTRNLSFHIAVGAGEARVPAPQPDVSGVAECTADQLNVVVGLTDGDNMNVPLNHFLRDNNWDSPNRGDLPLGWSIGPDLAILAPAAWDSYALEATRNDELVAMIGWGYGAPALLDDPADFYGTSFGLMGELGMRTFWSLGGGLDTPLSSYWDDLDAAARDGVPTGVLVGYGNATGSAFWSPAGRPAFTSRSVYSETPADLAQHLDDLLATPPADRPLVSFLSATNWSNPAGDLIDALTPYDDGRVRFLTPAEASACMPAPDPVEPPVSTPQSCLPGEPITQSGLALISDPTAAEITRAPTPFALPTTVAATPRVDAGGTIDYTATIRVDVAAFAATTLEDRVKPIVEAGYGPELAATAWVELAYTSLTSRLPLSDGTVPVGTPSASSSGPPAVARWGPDGVEVEIASLATTTADPTAAFDITVTWSAVAEARTEAFDASITAGSLTFDLALTIGVLLGTTPLTGSVTAPWVCAPGTAVLASTAVAAAPPAPAPPAGGAATPVATARPAFTG